MANDKEDPRELFLVQTTVFPGTMLIAAIDTVGGLDKDTPKRPEINEDGFAELHYPFVLQIQQGQTAAANAAQQAVRIMMQPINPFMPGDPMFIKLEIYYGPLRNPDLQGLFTKQVTKMRANNVGLIVP